MNSITRLLAMLAPILHRYRRQICPYCFDVFEFPRSPFRCGNLSCRGRTHDSTLAAHWPTLAAGAQGQVIDASNAKRGQVLCGTCRQLSRDRICPTCHVTLPYTFGTCANAMVAIIGAKNAGKSHYMTTLVEEFRSHIGPAMDVTLSPQDDDTIRRFARDFYDPLYKERRALDVTASAMRDPSVSLPLVFCLQFGGRDLFGRRTIARTVTLVFYHAAGEDLDAEATMSTVNRYIYHSDGIILLVDPRQIQGVRGKLPKSAHGEDVSKDVRDILTRTTKLIRSGLRLGANRMIKKPLAVAISKFDEIEPFMGKDMTVLSSRSVGRDYDLEEAVAISDEIESLLLSWNQKELVHDLRSWFARVAFFGASSLGCTKNPDNSLPRLAPRRVEDPFLWLLYQLGLIKAKKRGGVRGEH